MPSAIPQLSLAAGELAPSLWARVDLSRYVAGVRRLRNFIVLPQGGAQTRAGTEFAGEVPTSSEIATLERFVFSEAEAYALVFQPSVIRVYYRRAPVVYSSGPNAGDPVEIPTTYTADQLAELDVAGSADVLWITHPDHPVRELTRNAHDDWTLTDTTFQPTVSAPPSAPTLAEASDSNWGQGNGRGYVMTCVEPDTGEESVASPESWSDHNASDFYPIEVSIAPVPGITEYNVYAGQSGVYGYIGTTEYIGPSRGGVSNPPSGDRARFRDPWVSPDYTRTPPSGDNPFDAAGRYPSVVTLHQQRLVLAAPDDEPEAVFLSQSGLYRRFHRSKPPAPGDRMKFVLAGPAVDAIRWVVPLGRSLVIGTGGGIWRAAGGGDQGVFVADQPVDAKTEVAFGSEPLQPLQVGRGILYAQVGGRVIRDLLYSFEADGLDDDELSIWAAHLFEGRKVVAWAHQTTPRSVVWLVMSDGAVLSLTLQRVQQVLGWARHDFGGSVEDVTVVPEGEREGVYFIVRRTINGQTKRYVERLADRDVDEVAEACHVDSALRYDGRNTSDTTLTLSGGATWAAREELTITASASLFASTDVGDIVSFTGTERALRVKVTEYVSGTEVKGFALAPVPAALRDTPTTSWAWMRDTFAGLEHLEGQLVSVLGDGQDAGDATVAGGEITLDRHYSRVVVGLPIHAQIETLTLTDPRAIGHHQTTRISRVFVRVNETWGIDAADGASDRWESYHPEVRAEHDGPLPETSQLVTIPVSSRHATGGHVKLRQTRPLPLTVLSITPEIARA